MCLDNFFVKFWCWLSYLFLSLQVYVLQKDKLSAFKHLLANPDLSVWCNNIWVLGWFFFFKWQRRTRVLTEPLFDFQFSTLQAIWLWSLLPVENKPDFICNLHILAEEKTLVQYSLWPRERRNTIFCWIPHTYTLHPPPQEPWQLNCTSPNCYELAVY